MSSPKKGKLRYLDVAAAMDIDSDPKNIKYSDHLSQEEILSITPMTFLEEAAAVILFVFGVPGAAYSVPVCLLLLGWYFGATFSTLALGFLALLPLSFLDDSPSMDILKGWHAKQIVKYFSFKVSFVEPLPENQPCIMVAPPHGVFPFGNITTLIGFPKIFGYPMKGLASSAALKTPIFRQLLCSIGVIDASRESATQALRNKHVVGISTGGVAEVFEQNAKEGHEAIVLQDRKGLVKLAIRTGATIVPCYLFGNTKLYSMWYGGDEESAPLRKGLRWLSRKLGAATILFWGRCFLPIPYRIPIYGVMATPIRVEQSDEPKQEDIDRIHAEMVASMRALFDEHKASYGWADKQLIVK